MPIQDKSKGKEHLPLKAAQGFKLQLRAEGYWEELAQYLSSSTAA